MSVTVLGREQLVQNLSRWRESLVERIVTHTEIVQAQVVDFAKANHPYTDRTENLTNSIQPGRIVVQDDVITAEVAARQEYAAFVEFGTSRARPFPFLAPAIAAHAGEFRKRIQRVVAGA